MRKIRATLVTILLAVGITVAVQSPALAAWADCPVSYVCLWDDFNGGGAGHSIPWHPAGACYNVPTSFNDKANSAYNRTTTRSVRYYTDAGCVGHLLHSDANCSGGPWGPNTAVGGFYIDDGAGGVCNHVWPISDNNRLTSVKFS